MPNVDFSLSLLEQFKPVQVFTDHNRIVTSLEYDRSGTILVSGSGDSCIRVYDPIDGTLMHKIMSYKYGIGPVQFTNSKHAVLIGSQHHDHAIRCLSLHDSNYIRSFRGHKSHVNSMMASSVSDIFISASPDDSVRLWDLNSKTSISYLPIKEKVLVALDPQSLVFAIATSNDSIRLYDCRNSTQGPFAYWRDTHLKTDGYWNNIVFSPDGKLIMISTSENEYLLVDAFTGEKKHSFIQSPSSMKNYHNFSLEKNDSLDADERQRMHKKFLQENACPGTFSPDSRYVMAGSPAGLIRVWDLNSDSVIQLKYHHMPIFHAKFNPAYLQLATSDVSTVFWHSNKHAH